MVEPELVDPPLVDPPELVELLDPPPVLDVPELVEAPELALEPDPEDVFRLGADGPTAEAGTGLPEPLTACAAAFSPPSSPPSAPPAT